MNTSIISENASSGKVYSTVQLRISAVLRCKTGRWATLYALVMMFGLQKLTDMPANFAVACAMTIAILVGCFLYKDKLQRESVRFLSYFFYVED